MKRPFSPVSGGGLSRLTARLGLAFGNVCWLKTNPAVIALLIYISRRVLGMIPQDGSSKKVPRWQKIFFFQVFCGLQGMHTVSLF